MVDVPAGDAEIVPEKEKIEDEKVRGPRFHCELSDTELVNKIAQVLLPGLAAACVDNTTGDMFRSPGSVAVEIRKELIDYLTHRSESFVAESVVLEGGPEGEVSDHPYDIISDMVDDFASLKTNLLSRVSEWLLSEKREDKIDDFVQEMEINGFWLLDRRAATVQNLVKNVDFKNLFHCDKKFNTAEELAEHVANCGFRSMNCANDGCTTVFSASHLEKHDSVCPFKIIPCEQHCSENIMRREMDRHCITVCPMKIVSCPFYSVGCQSTVPHSMIQQHRSDDLHSHLLYTLKNIRKGVSERHLKKRVDQILESSSDQLAEARDARALTLQVKNIEAKLGPLEVNAAEEVSEESAKVGENISVESTEVGKISSEKSTKESAEVAEIGSKKSTETVNEVGEEEFSNIEI